MVLLRSGQMQIEPAFDSDVARAGADAVTRHFEQARFAGSELAAPDVRLVRVTDEVAGWTRRLLWAAIRHDVELWPSGPAPLPGEPPRRRTPVTGYVIAPYDADSGDFLRALESDEGSDLSQL